MKRRLFLGLALDVASKPDRNLRTTEPEFFRHLETEQ